MRSTSIGRRPAAILAACLILAAGIAIHAHPALAQCPMCGKAAEYAGTKPGAAYRTFVAAVLVLLAPALGILGGFGALLWKHRGDGGRNDEDKP